MRIIRNHCHYSGQYRGPAHKSCNLAYKIPSYIPIVFHNLSGYDAHLFIRELGNKFDTGKIGVIAENKEKYISFTVDIVVDSYTDTSEKVNEKKSQLRFIDSVRFMASSLDSLTSNLVVVNKSFCKNCDRKERFELTHISEYYVTHGNCRNCSEYVLKQLIMDSIINDFDNLRDNHTDEQLRLLLRKGAYPYEYVSSRDKFEETRLPPKKAFHSNLNMSAISDHDYQHAQKVWKEFGLKSLGKYCNFHLQTDVLLLRNVFETFCV